MSIVLRRIEEPISKRKTIIEVETSYLPQMEKLFYDNHLPYEKKGDKLHINTRQLQGLVETLVGFEYEVEDKTLLKRIEGFGLPQPLPRKEANKVEFKVPPYKSQIESTTSALGKRTSLIADKMGKGKTFTGIMFAEHLASRYDFKHALILNGISNNQYNWKKEVEKFSYRGARIIGEREITKGVRKGAIRISSNADKLKDLEEGIDEFYLIANIHMLRDPKILDKLKEMIYNGDIGTIVVDEVHKCIGITTPSGKKNTKGKAIKIESLKELKPYFRVAMSGTPFNNPTDLYDIEAWLGRAFSTKTDYELRYGEHVLDKNKAWLRKKNPYMIPTIYKMTNPQLFSQEISRYLIKSAKTNDLPPIVFENYYVELHAKQLKALESTDEGISIYNLVGKSLDEMRNEISKPQHMTQRRIISYPHSEGIEEDAKLDALIEILEEIESNGDSAVVFTYFRELPTYYKEKITHIKGIYVEGDDDANTIFEKAQRFQEGEGTFLVGGYGKIGTGLNIERADYAIFVDTPLTWNDYEQSIFRLLRGTRGDRPVNVIKLVAIGTYDEIIQDNVKEKKLQQDQVIGKTMSDEAVEV